MAKKPTITTLKSGFNSTTTLNNNFTALRNAFDNTLSLDGSTPNAMNADLDMNSNDLLNVGDLDVQGLTIDGVAVYPRSTQLATTYATQSYTGNGSTTVYSMGFNPGVKANVNAYIDGVHQNQDAFNIRGTSLTFTAAPPLNSAIEIKVPVNVTSLVNTNSSQLVYNQGGAGAQDRSVQSRLRDFVSVKDFGAVGDGVADDTAAIRAAVNTVYTSGGGVVFFPNNGTYLVTSPIPLRTNVYLVGPATLKAGSTNNVVGEATPSVAHTNVGVIDLVIDGNRANVSFPSDDADGNALRLNMVSRSVFRNVWVKNSVFNAVSVYNNSNDNFFSDIRITDAGKSGALPAVYTFNGIFLEAGSSRNKFNNIYINTTRQYGIWVGARDADNFDNQFSNIWIAGTFGDGIRVGDEATSNKSARTLFSNISVLSAGDMGIRLYHAGTGSVEEVIITGGQVRDCTNRGILLDTRSIKCKVSSVDFRGNGVYGITNAGSDNSIIGCSSSGHGLDNYTDTGTNTISVGTIPGDGRTGTFTPVVLTGGAAVGRTYSDRFGSYRVNGNRVDYKIRIVLSAVGSSTGALTIGSLPFTSDNPAFETPTIACANLTYTGDVKGLVLNGTTEIKLYSMSSGSGLTALTNTALASNTEFYISGTYEIKT